MMQLPKQLPAVAYARAHAALVHALTLYWSEEDRCLDEYLLKPSAQ